MKKFILSVTVFFLPIFLICVTLEALLRGRPNDYSYKRDYLEKHSKDIEILFLGSSHVYYGINPEFIKANSFNASHVSQSLNYDLEILKKYDKNWNSLKYIVVAVDYFSLYSTLDSWPDRWRVKNYSIYYDIKLSYDPSDNFELLNGSFSKNLERIGNYYIKKIPNISCNSLGWGTSFHSDSNINLEDAGVAAARRHTVSIDGNLYFSKNIAVVNAMIKFAAEKNIKMIFITCPAYRSYVEHLEPRQLNTTINSIEQIVKNNPPSKYYNLLNDSSFIDKDFFDADHLNEIGAKKLTLKIDSLIGRD